MGNQPGQEIEATPDQIKEFQSSFNTIYT